MKSGRCIDSHQGLVRIQEGGVWPGGAAISEDKRSLQMPYPASSSLPPTPWKRECPTPCFGPGCAVPPATPIPLTDTQTGEKWELGLSWLNSASPPGTQVRNALDSGKNGRSVLEKEDRKVLVPGPRKEGASWASLVIAITRTWSQNS